MVLNGLPEHYEHFLVQEGFNPVGSFVALQTRLMIYEESRSHRENVHDVNSHVTMTSRNTKPQHESFTNFETPSRSSTGQLTCYFFGMKGLKKAECPKREKDECIFCQLKGQLVQAGLKKTTGSKPGTLSSSVKSDRASSEATRPDLVVDSGSTDHKVVTRNWFKNIRKLDTTENNPEGGNTKCLGIAEVAVLCKDVKRRSMPLILRKTLCVPGYKINLISVSSIIDNGHKVLHGKKKSFLCLRSQGKISITWKELHFTAHDTKATHPIC